MKTSGDNIVNNKNRVDITGIIWGTMAFALFGLFLSGLGDAGLTIIHLLVALALLIVPSVATGYLWNWGRGFSTNETHAEKAKRDRLEEVLRNLSNAELQALKARFRNNEIDDEMLYAYMDEDDQMLSEQN